MVRIRRCILCRRTTSESVSLLKFPQDNVTAAQWAVFCGISLDDVKPTTSLCTVHFTPDCYKTTVQDRKRKCLKNGVIPTLVCPPTIGASSHSGVQHPTDYVRTEIDETTTQSRDEPTTVEEGSNTNDTDPHNNVRTEMSDKPVQSGCRIYERGGGTARRFCCICGSVKIKPRLRFYRFPKNAERRTEWLQSLEIAETELKDWHRVCSQHFLDGDPNGVPVRPVVNYLHPFTERNVIRSSSVQDLEPEVLVIDCMSDNSSKGREHLGDTVVHDAPKQDPLLISELPSTAHENLERQNSNDTEVGIDAISHKGSERNEQLPIEHTIVLDTSEGKPILVPVLVLPVVQSPNKERPRISYASLTPAKPLRYFDDFKTSDLGTLHNKQRCLELGKTQLRKYRLKVQSLSAMNKRMQGRLKNIGNTVSTLHQNKMISDSAAATLKKVVGVIDGFHPGTQEDYNHQDRASS